MSQDETGDSPRTVEEQVRDFLKKAHVSFAMAPGAMAAPRAEAPAAEEESRRAERVKAVREFSLKPRDIRDYLDRFVIRQDEAKKVLSVAICDHYNHVRRCLEDPALVEREHAKHNIILLGPTGVGKTYLMRCIARLVGVPFVKADATKFSETGYVGHDVEDLARDLVKAADGDVDLASYGIIYLDEVDKIAAAPTSVGRDVSGRGVQINLLKLMEDTEVSLFSQTDLIGQMQAVFEMQRGGAPGRRTINTRHILFIVSGAFSTLAEQVQRRVSSARIGFASADRAGREESEYLRQATTRDLIDYGFESEFVGRLPVRVVCDALTVEDLVAIMRQSEDNILAQYAQDFAGYGIDLRVDDAAAGAIARRAHEEKTGARGLMTVLERVCREFKFELPSTGIRALTVTEQTVSDPAAALTTLLEHKEDVVRETLRGDVRGYAETFEREHGLRLNFAADAVDYVVDACLSAKATVRGWCAEHLRDFEYAFKLIARNTGRSAFNVTRRLVENPEAELSRRVAQSFRKSADTED